MSNKAVSGVYRNIIDNVIAAVRQDFDDMGIEKEVLEELQRSWEAKVIASQVAHFEGAPALPPPTTIRKGAKQEPVEPSVSGSSKSSKAARTDLNADVSKSRSHSSEPNGNGTAPASSQASSSGGAAADDADGDSKAGKKRKRPLDSEEIGSDLDDTDEEDDDANGDINDDMILCLYEKVQRTRNKWKVVMRDGIASIEGRDYLFSRCAGDFDWLA
ncbi:transcription factor IIA subunit alpha [Tilletia horrida]|uniref:Transcription initiation factor IIA large subunit n=1 Tax=Tilletia horrida TaxID=155126 RepID=A0AAN6JPM0_9BASI|nr:transcription factor IIA subunit alpha [Tilletia horrida]KAK0553171.1 transcription factor IIA subunit alpha [Tilletia horrida]KAK0567623.1 transcription factor IIA subunit alpha [Tilletia horrida]